MKSFFRLILLFACTLLGLQANAQQVSIEEAQAKAVSFLNGSTLSKVRKVKAQASSLELAYQAKAKSGDKSLFYVFNSTTTDGGYVIVGGDEAAQEILGYGESGAFDYAKIPENFKWWLSQYGLQIEAAIADVQSGKATVMNAAAKRKLAKRKAKANIPYLLTTEWDQVAPFNSQIPLYAQGFTGQDALATGCVATAAAQVMKYHNWPDRGIGSHQLNRAVNGEYYSADFGNTTYDWDNMQNKYDYDKYTGSDADKAVGTLMYHIGVAVDMEYGQLRSGGSGASTHTLAIRLADTFKYDRGIKYEYRSSYTDLDWEDMVYAELQASRPVLYSGSSDAPDGGGHAFVCDGYQDGRYHINWGWNGSYNNYFLLTATSTEKALAPNGTGSGGSAANSSYTRDQAVIINIKPDYDGTSQPVKSIEAGIYTLPATEVSRGERTYINGFMYNRGLFEDTFDFAVKLVNTSDPTDVHIVESETSFTIEPNHGKGYIYYYIPNDVRYGAYYYVYPMFKNDNNEWQLATLPLVFDVPYLQIETPTGLNVEELSISNNGYVSNENFDITLEIKNWGNYPTSAPIILWVFPYAGGNSVDYIDLGTVSLNSKESKKYNLTIDNFRSKNKFEIGQQYYIKAQNRSAGQYISSNVNFTFCDNLSIDYTMSPVEWGTICLPFDAEVPSSLTAYSVTSVGDDGILVKEEVEKFNMNTPYLVNGNAGTYTFSGPNTPVGSNYKSGVLVGNTAPSVEGSYVYAPKDSYVLQKNSEGLGFYKVENANSQKIRQYSAYLKPANTYYANSFFSLPTEATAIKTVKPSAENSRAYRPNGVMTDRNAKGLVIVNGKLMLNK